MLNTRARHPSGFTLIELLLVMVILAILAAVVVPKFTGQGEKAKLSAAKSDIASYKVAISAFEVENSRFPTQEEGLSALVNKPADCDNWKHPYVEQVKKDPWGHDYVYRIPGTAGKDFDLFSMGPDGREGGGDDVE
jgi:general secretion pathway protein G